MHDGRTLVVIAGPIGAGKSTVAAALGQRLHDFDVGAAVVDLDDITFMQRAKVTGEELWRRGSAATCALVRAWFDNGATVVITHGPFFESGGYDVLAATVPGDVRTVHVLLRVPVDVAIERVESDQTRGMSRDPAFLRSTHIRFGEIEPTLPKPDVVFDTAAVDIDTVVNGVLDKVAVRP